MNIIRMTGGLGNQMFQYALYLKLKNQGKDVKFDDQTEYENRNARPILLWVFGIDYPAASRKEIHQITDGSRHIFCRLRRRIFGRKSMEYHEAGCDFDEQVLRKEPAYLTGYFQSEKYFKDMEQQVRSAFSFSDQIWGKISEELAERIRAYQREIEGSDKAAVSVHIRRGDYLENQEVYGGICTEAYYQKAIAVIKEKIPSAVFFIFSNEKEWVLEWLSRAYENRSDFVMIEGTDEETGYLDLFLMSRCRHHIIANSSFSWWGAWLNPDKKKIVIAPEKWVNHKEMKDIYTEEMIRISSDGQMLREKSAGKKQISVIVAAYNIESYLPRCLDSLIGQSYQNLEIIVVDDGSDDKTGAICDRYALKDARVKVIHQQNGGLSEARNAGLAIAAGDYVGYVDGDDWVEPDMYEEMLAACEKEGAQMAVCAYRKIQKEKAQEQFTRKNYVLSRDEALDIYLCDNKPYHIYNSVWSKLFRKDLIQELRFPAGKKSEDIMYTTKALVHTNLCVFLDTPYYNYVLDREDSIMNNKLHERRFGDEIPFWKEQIAYLKEQGLEEFSEKAFYYFCRRMLFYFVEFKDKKMTDSAREMVRLLRSDKKAIQDVYRRDFAAFGDQVRMKVFLLNPVLFYYLVKLYDKIVIPLRQ